MGPGLNAVCVGREEQSYKSDLPYHGRGGEGRGGGRTKDGGDKKGGVILSYQIRLAQRGQDSEVFPSNLPLQ